LSRQRGSSLLELVVALAILGALLMMIVSLQSQMFHFERTMRIELMTHPETMAVLARVRKDVLDATGYPATAGSYVQSPTVLILGGTDERGQPIQIVYDFQRDQMVVRATFHAGTGAKIGEWVARGVPRYRVSSYEMPDGSTAVRLQGEDRQGRLTIDQIYEPRRKS